MANYNFRKEAEVWYEAIATDGALLTPVQLDVSSISFNQTFTDKTYSQKTIHNSDRFFEQSNITKANPASFEFKLNVLEETRQNLVYNGLLKAGKFNLYIRTRNNGHVYKLDTGVFTSGKFVIEKLETLALTLSGEAAKLSVLKGADASATHTKLDNAGTELIAPGTTLTHQRVKHLEAKFTTPGGSAAEIDLEPGLLKASVELQNDITWIPYTTLNDALNVTDESNTMYPSNFTVGKKVLSGSFQTYVIDSTDVDDIQTWNQHNVELTLKAGTDNTKGFSFDLDHCSFTNRVNVEEVFTQNFDWKFNGDPDQTDLTQLIKFNNISV